MHAAKLLLALSSDDAAQTQAIAGHTRARILPFFARFHVRSQSDGSPETDLRVRRVPAEGACGSRAHAGTVEPRVEGRAGGADARRGDYLSRRRLSERILAHHRHRG